MTTPPIVGLLGKKRSGKDSFAKALVSRHGYTPLAFADALRGVLLEANPTLHTEQPTSHSPAWRLKDEVERYGWDVAKGLPEVRRLLQQFGDRMREVNPDIWLGPVYRGLTAGDGPFVITDVRYPNEANLIESLGGELVRITRPGLDRGPNRSGVEHISETALDSHGTAYVVHNDASLGRLADQASKVHNDLTRSSTAVQI